MKRSIATLLAVSAAAGAAAVSCGAAYATGYGYGPAPAAGQTSSGGFSQVLATATRGPAGGTLSANAGGTSVSVSIPAATLKIPLQLTLTAPNLARLGRKLGNVRGGVGVMASKPGGTPIRGRLSAGTISVTLNNHAFHPGDRVVVWNARSRSFAAVPRGQAELTDGKVTIRFNRPSEFAVLPPR